MITTFTHEYPIRNRIWAERPPATSSPIDSLLAAAFGVPAENFTESSDDGTSWWPEAKATDKRCIQCGATPAADGTLDCGH